jgi:NitT/TauT family transport system substrate-binding protein
MFARRLHLLLIHLLAVAALLLAACGLATPTPSSRPLRVAWLTWPGFYPMAIAVEQGLFAKHGLAVEPVFYTVLSDIYPDFAAGKLDGALIPLGDLLPLVKDDNARAVLVIDNSAGADQIIATADVASPADLKGKRIGVNFGSFAELFVRQMLEANQLTPEQVTLMDVDPEMVPEAMPDSIQAGYTYEPYTSQAMTQGHHVIFSSAETPGLIPDVLALRAMVIAERPEDVRRFITAWFEAVQFWQAHPDESAQMIARQTGLRPEEVSTEGVRLFDLELNRRAFRPGSDESSLYFTGQAYIDFLISSGSLTTQLDINRVLDPSFVR